MLANEDFYQEFLVALHRHQVQYMIFGGFAVNFYGFVRVTEDLDVWVNSEKENLQRFKDAVISLGFPEDAEMLTKFVSQQVIMLRLSEEEFRVDIITKLNIRKNFNEAFKTAQTVEMPYGKVFFLDYADLIDEKIRAKRPKDLIDVDQLRTIRGEWKQ